jgi:hypothetical protein
MDVSVSSPEPDEHSRAPLVMLTAASVPTSGLEYETELGAGVSVVVDVGAPHAWRSVTIESWTEDAKPLIQALMGEFAAERLGRLLDASQVKHDGGILYEEMTVDLSAAAPWLRVATADGLNRWLYLPLDQSLLDAERAVARARAAMTLARGTVLRSHVISEALQYSRLAAAGFSSYLGALDSLRAIPEGLHTALRHLVGGYTLLLKEVRGPARDLSGVIERWKKISGRSRRKRSPEQGREPFESPDNDVRLLRQLRRNEPPGSVIDPRQVRARILGLSSDPSLAEVTLVDTTLGGHEAVLVRVPAYGSNPDAEIGDHLLVRLVDRSSGSARSQALLTLEQTAEPRAGAFNSVFQGTVPLRGARMGDLRADINDVTSTLPPASADTDPALQQVRRATLFLREVRRLVADVRLPSVGVKPGVRLRRIAQLLEPINGGSHADEPMFAGGPSATELYRWAETGDDQLLELLRGDIPSGGVDDHEDRTRNVFSLTQGSASLLVAELAAALAPS